METAMQQIEKIKVNIDIVDGKTVCICKFGKKKCRKNCEVDVVERDKFNDWETTFKRDKYGKSRD